MSHCLLDACIGILDQGEALLQALDDEEYGKSRSGGASLGAHYRHCLEHFQSLFDGVPLDLIDYDARKRDPQIETLRAVGIERTRELRRLAQAFDATLLSQTVTIRCAISIDEKSPLVASTIEREMMFCISHAVHHYALMVILCRDLKLQLPEGFGVAPSTLNYRKAS